MPTTVHTAWDGVDQIDSYIETVFNSFIAGRQVVRVEDADLSRDPLRDLILISLFTWRRATDDDPVPAGANRQGWWADPTLGSRLWLLKRAKFTPKTLATARRYIEEALEWLVDEGILRGVVVNVERQGNALAMSVTVQRPRDPRDPKRYDFIWGA